MILKSIEFGALGNSGIDDIELSDIVDLLPTDSMNFPSIRFVLSPNQRDQENAANATETFWWFGTDIERNDAISRIIPLITNLRSSQKNTNVEPKRITLSFNKLLADFVTLALFVTGVVYLTKDYFTQDKFDPNLIGIVLIILPIAIVVARSINSYLLQTPLPNSSTYHNKDFLVLRRQISDLNDSLLEIKRQNESKSANGNESTPTPKQSHIATSTKQKSSPFAELFFDLESSRARIEREVDATGNRGNVNLIIGGTTTIVAAIVLFFSLFSVPKYSYGPSYVAMMLNYYLPRVSIVIFVEIFAFFFLRLYRNTLSEVKYYQNELTNLEARYLALKVALTQENDELTKLTAVELLKTERNFVLKKGETTIGIETAKHQDSSDGSFMKGFKSAAEAMGSIFNQVKITKSVNGAERKITKRKMTAESKS